MKENKDFFEAYEETQAKRDRMSEEETSSFIHKIISNSSKHDDNNNQHDHQDTKNN